MGDSGRPGSDSGQKEANMERWELLALVILASLGTIGLSEFLSWLWLYRSESYRKLKDAFDTCEKLVEKTEEKSQAGALKGGKNKNSKLQKLKTRKERTHQMLMAVQMKSTVALALVMITVGGTVRPWFAGKVVARLPFEAPGFARSLSHLNLLGSDYHDCSSELVFLLCSFAMRPALQRILGHKQVKMPTSMQWPPVVPE